MMIVAVV